MRSADELRQGFLDFFAGKGHKLWPGWPLIPGDETTLFTSAGVQQFVPAFRGDVPPPAPRLATCQKCFRADDIEEVGDAWHETFFEMLGNFSIGDYFKEEAITWAWEFSVERLALPKDRIWITIHPTDDEAERIWRDKIGVPPGRIVRLEENWWPLSEDWVGSCGPDSELLLDTGEERGCRRPTCGPDCSCGRFNEYWNLVFPQYFRDASGQLTPLPKPGIDTGLGLERLAALMQGAPSIYETDLFQPVVERLVARAREVNKAFRREANERAVRIVSEHSRAIAFLLADGVWPSNQGRGYVLRRVIRRAHRFGRQLGIEGAFLADLLPAVIEIMGAVYPELPERRELILKTATAEEERFQTTLEQGSVLLEERLRELKRRGGKVLPGTEAFRLYDTSGFPLDLTVEIAAEHSLQVDRAGFDELMEAHVRLSGTITATSSVQAALTVHGAGYGDFVGATEFVGYERTEADGRVLALRRDGQTLDSAGAGETVEIVLDRTPFYSAAGGQIGDTGWIEGDGVRAEVLDTKRPIEGVVVHHVKVERGTLRTGLAVQARVDAPRRAAIARAHTATHLLHWALRQRLGPHATQAGSLVAPDRLRFDLSHLQALSATERADITELVNQRILEDKPVTWTVVSREAARQAGAIALFGEKYGEEVRMVAMGDFSKELCGGTHLDRTAAIGAFLITSEGSIGAGLRRIEAVTGMAAVRLAEQRGGLLSQASEALRCPPEEAPDKIAAALAEIKRLGKELNAARSRGAGELARELAGRAEAVDGIPVLAASVPDQTADALRALADRLLEILGSGVVVLGTVADDKVLFVSEVSADLAGKVVHAGNLLREVAKVAGGGGGGRPNFAQAGGQDPSKLEEALARVRELVRSQRADRG